jgi:hypothetical protein
MTQATDIFATIADGLDASTDGRGWGAEHEAARRLANAAPDMLAALRKAEKELTGFQGMTGTPDPMLAEIRAAIAAATGAPISEPANPIPAAQPISDFEGHAFTIEAAQGYISNPNDWNPPTPAQLAHLLALSGISHGPVAADDWDLREANDGERCTACGRDGLDCSADPCDAVIADRES